MFRIQISICFLFSFILIGLSSYYPYWSYRFLEGTQEVVVLHVLDNTNYGSGFVSSLFIVLKLFLFLNLTSLLFTIFLFSKTAFQSFAAKISFGLSVLCLLFSLLSAFSLQSKLGSGDILSYPSAGFYLMLSSSVLALLGVRLSSRATRSLNTTPPSQP